MEMEVHREPFLHLVDLAHDRVMIGWGAFWFWRKDPDDPWSIVDDEQLDELTGRQTCIGSSAEPFGAAVVEVFDADGNVAGRATTSDKTWVEVQGLHPDSAYTYQVSIDNELWAEGPRHDWLPSASGGYDLASSGRSYITSFHTWPEPTVATPPFRFVALGDYGVGVRSDTESSRRQRRIAEVLDYLVESQDVRFVLSLGDNIYQGELGAVDDESGGEDDDWYSSFFAPYRYAIARVPVFPAIGNHDSTDTEGSDDRAQMEDNFHIAERFHDDSDRSSVDPGLFYRLHFGRDVELVCIDTSLNPSQEDGRRFFQDDKHRRWLQQAFAQPDIRWRIPFAHHPAFCAGPSHENDQEIIDELVPLFDRGGVRLVLAGHEHNFQMSEDNGRTHVISGAGGQVREDLPKGFSAAQTVAWSGQAHLLLAEVDGNEVRLTPMSGMLPNGRPHLMGAQTPSSVFMKPPFVISAGPDSSLGELS